MLNGHRALLSELVRAREVIGQELASRSTFPSAAEEEMLDTLEAMIARRMPNATPEVHNALIP